ncbi:glycoside hydrolase family 172 protein [Paenibacillus puerhi]|uniref:glycoside hydrolase family 172 protein n=1 Tax=Paenibacillus puerhi TaxID=2692622 RepID=UPI001359924D|nr:glycoside hydrolase family 172 protein [Paenibacillus puerhi]
MSIDSINFLGNLTKTKHARSARASSWDQTGRDQDYWMIPAGETVILADIEGPGCITHMWMTSFCRRMLGPSIMIPRQVSKVASVLEIHNALGVSYEVTDPAWYRKVLIKMTWDDQAHPSVLTPLGDFFCIGHSMPGTFSSLPFTVSAKPGEEYKFGGVSSVNCYLPMPFNKKAKIEIINENDVPFGLFFYIDYEMYKQSLSEETVYFHAQWHRENPCDGWAPEIQVNSPEVNSVPNIEGKGNYVILEAEGQGHYIGCNHSVAHFEESWWGEGDDMFFIDGEPIPSIVGTGGEDYFGHAWGMQKVSFPFCGSIVHENDAPGYQVSYRFHVLDPVYFSKSIRVTMEHGHANHLADDWSTTAYWYQTLPSKPFGILPVEQRIQRMPERQKPPVPNVKEREDFKDLHNVYLERFDTYQAELSKEMEVKFNNTRKFSQGNIDLSQKLRQQFDKE